MLSTAFLWHNYGKSTIGTRADIENVPIERLQAFYQKYYQPDNAVLLVAGKFDEAKTLELVSQYFGADPAARRATLPKLYTEEPTQDGERSVTLRRVGDVQCVGVGYHVPAGSHPDYAAVSLLAQVLGDEPSGRLYKALVETKKATQRQRLRLPAARPGVLRCSRAEVRQESLARRGARRAAAGDRRRRDEPADQRRGRARRARPCSKQIELDLNNSDRVGLQLSEWIGMGDWRLLFLHRDRLRKATAEDVQRVAATYLKPSNRTVGLFIPTRHPTAPRSRHGRTSPRCVEGLQGRRGRSPRAKRSTRRPPTSRRGPPARLCPTA